MTSFPVLEMNLGCLAGHCEPKFKTDFDFS